MEFGLNIYTAKIYTFHCCETDRPQDIMSLMFRSDHNAISAMCNFYYSDFSRLFSVVRCSLRWWQLIDAPRVATDMPANVIGNNSRVLLTQITSLKSVSGLAGGQARNILQGGTENRAVDCREVKKRAIIHTVTATSFLRTISMPAVFPPWCGASS